MKVFITGGAGYIGSHTTHILANAGHEVVVFDNLSSGNLHALPSGASFVEGDVTDKIKLNLALSTHKPDAVIHFAAFIEVEESISKPLKYYHNNVFGTLNLLEACANQKINKFIFSSTAAVYGESSTEALSEESPKNPINPYGCRRRRQMVPKSAE